MKLEIKNDENPLSLEGNKERRNRIAREQAKKTLDENIHLNEEEKKSKLEDFDNKGSFTHPASTLFENNGTVIELKGDTEVKTEKELLDEIDLQHMDFEDQEKIRKIFKENIACLSVSEMDIPICPLVTAKPELNEDAKKKGVQNCKFRDIPVQIKDQVDKVLAQMVSAGILKFTNKPTHIVSNLICTAKKDLSPRILLDARLINDQCLKIPYQLEPMQSVFQHFHGGKFCSSVDISNSYFSIEIEESMQPIFSFFNSKKQMLTFTRCAQGFKNSGAHLQVIASKIKEKNPNVCSFVDDLYLVTKGDFQDHCEQLRKLLRTLVEFKLKIKGRKAKICTLNLDVLGHNWHIDRFSIP